MTTEQAIRNRWSSYYPLTSVVPMVRFYTDEFPTNNPTRPYVVLTLEGETKDTFSSGDNSYIKIMRFNVFDDNGERGEALCKEGGAIRARFNRWTEGDILTFRFQDKARTPKGQDGMWHWMLDFEALVREAG